MNPFNNYNQETLCYFEFAEYKLVLIKYPIWKGYVAAKESDIWIKVYPKIDVKNKKIIFSKNSNNYLISELPDRSLTESNDSYNFEINQRNSEKFFNSIPDEIVELVSIYSDSNWELVNGILLLGDDFKNLIKTNPALAFIIVNIEKFSPSFLYYSNISLLQKLIQTKRQKILGLCGFPETVQMVKIFSKIEPNVIDLYNFLRLRNIFLNKEKEIERILDFLSFSKKINQNSLTICLNFKHLLDKLENKILFELSNRADFKFCLNVLDIIHNQSLNWKVDFPKISSLSNISEVIEKFGERLREKKLISNMFPNPPLKDNEFIKALDSGKELNYWAKRQQNCIRSYLNDIKKGKCYLYKIILEDEEATLEIKLFKNKIVLGKLLGFQNKPVSDALKQKVIDWFNNQIPIL